MLTHIGNGVFLTKNGCNSSYPCGTLTLCAKYSCKSGSCSQSLNLTFTLSEIPYSGIPRLFFTTNRNRTAAVTIYATIQQQKCTNVTYYTETYSAISDVSAPLLVRASAQSLPRTLVTDSNSSLADFKAIPILDSNESIANISILRLCLNPVACRNDLVLNLATVTYRDMLSNVKTSLTLDETAQVVLDFVVSNRGDDIFTIVMTVAGMPAYVNAITFLTDGQSSDCNQLSNNTTFNCSTCICKYLLHNESKSVTVTMTVVSSSIGLDSNNITFNVSSRADDGIDWIDNSLMVSFKPVVSATLDVLSLSFSPSQRYYRDPTSASNPTDLDAIGYPATLVVDIQRSGPTTIPNLTLIISFPQGGNDWSSFYLYPASVAMDPPSANLSCIGGLIDPQMILAAKTKRREGLGGRTVDASMLMRAAVRQTEAEVEALQSSTLLSTVDCSQSPKSTECVNLVCYVTNITSTITAFSMQITLYVNDKYLTVRGGQYNLTASIAASILDSGFGGVVKQAVAKGLLNVVPLPVTSKKVNVHVILWPIIGSVSIMVIALILLYSVGFFNRKHGGPKEDEDNIEDEDTAIK